MGRRNKLYQRLEELEAELIERAVPALRRVAAGRDGTFFWTSRFMRVRALQNRTRGDTDALLELADEVLALRRKLREPVDTCPAATGNWRASCWTRLG
jgi:hypothetical protein